VRNDLAAERDFLGKKTLEEELANLDAQVSDMQSLNLFGVNIEPIIDDSKVLDHSSRKVLQDLVTLTQKIDPMGISMDFSKRKAFTYYDPYNEDANQEYHSLLRWTDNEEVSRASLVINQFRIQFDQLNKEIKRSKTGSQVNFIEAERLKQIEFLLDRLGRVKIIDASVLLKLYDLYRYRPDQ
jgi:hypothetical protein